MVADSLARKQLVKSNWNSYGNVEITLLTLQELSQFLDRPKNASMKVVWGPAAFDFWTKLELFKSYLETTEQFLVTEAQLWEKSVEIVNH